MKAILIFLFFFTCVSFSQKAKMSDAFKKGDYKNVIKYGKQILEKDPLDLDALLGIGKAYNSTSQYKKSFKYLLILNKYAKNDWQFAWSHIELTEAYFSTGNKRKAKEHYYKSLKYKGTKTSNKKMKRLSFLFGFHKVYKNWKTIERNNIIFHFQDVTLIKNLNFYMQVRENAFKNINSFFSSKLPKKIDFFVWKSNEEAKKVLGINLGKSFPKYCVSHNGSNQTIGHEIAHNISFWMDSSITKTRFINEGIGVYFDNSSRNKLRMAKTIFQKQKVEITNLWKNGSDYSEKILYPIAGAFVENLIQLDKEKFLELCKNQTYKNAKIIYEKDLDKIISDFEKQLNTNP